MATLTINLDLHPKARDGQPNAWKIEIKDEKRRTLLAQTADTARGCLALADEYLQNGCIVREQTFRVPPAVTAMADTSA